MIRGFYSLMMMFLVACRKYRKFILAVSLSYVGIQVLPAYTVNNTMQDTLKFSPRLKAAHEGHLIAKEGVRKARARFHPQADYIQSLGRQHNQYDRLKGYSDVNDGTLNVDQPIFEGFGNVSAYRRSRLQEKAAEQDYNSELQEVLLTAAVSHIYVARDQHILELSKKNEDAHMKQLEATRLRQQYGELTQTDVYQAEARLAEAQAFTLGSKRSLALSKAEYNEVVGKMPLDTILMPVEFPFVPKDLKKSVDYALDLNPVLKSAAYQESVKLKEIYEAESKLMPRVFTRGRFNWDQNSGTSRSSDSENYSLTVNLEFPLYNGMTRSDIRKSRIVYRQAKFEHNVVRRRVEREAVSGWEQFSIAASIIATRQKAVEEAHKTLSGYREEYSAGNRTTVNVLNAESDYFESQIALMLSKSDHAVSAYLLMVAAGQLQGIGLVAGEFAKPARKVSYNSRLNDKAVASVVDPDAPHSVKSVDEARGSVVPGSMPISPESLICRALSSVILPSVSFCSDPVSNLSQIALADNAPETQLSLTAMNRYNNYSSQNSGAAMSRRNKQKPDASENIMLVKDAKLMLANYDADSGSLSAGEK